MGCLMHENNAAKGQREDQAGRGVEVRQDGLRDEIAAAAGWKTHFCPVVD